MRLGRHGLRLQMRNTPERLPLARRTLAH